jgi:hypothetical protein
MTNPEEKLGRFGHHPDPAIDFEVEVESLESIWIDRERYPLDESFLRRMQRAVAFKVGGHPVAVEARRALLKLADDFKAECLP